MAIATTTEFLETLHQLHLVPPEQLETLRRQLPAVDANPRHLAQELIQRGWLTPYQGNRLLQGRGAELRLGSYVLLERLGEGAMGAVFKAKNWKLGQVVALKVIRKERVDNPAAIQRFQREIRASAQLNHPNIVRAFDADEVDGTHLLVMEFVAGSDLTQVIKQAGPLPVAQACDCIRQVALGLQHAHEHGLVHRDIKPSNLLLTSQGTVKILDLGLARMSLGSDEENSGSLTGSGTILGTPDYLAPEQTQEAHDVDIRADLYSLGCTLYYLLTGQVPFPGGNIGAKLVKHQVAEPVPVEQLRPEVPAAVAALVRQLMAKKPEDRYQTPAELVAALEGLGNGPGQAPDGAVRADAPSLPGTSFSSVLEPADTAEALAAPRPPGRAVPEQRWLWRTAAGGGVLLGLVGLVFILVQPPGTDPRKPPELPEGPSLPTGARPLDALRREQISAYELAVAGGGSAKQAPSSLVGVLGDSRLKHWDQVRSVAFHPEGRLLASGGMDRMCAFGTWRPVRRSGAASALTQSFA